MPVGKISQAQTGIRDPFAPPPRGLARARIVSTRCHCWYTRDSLRLEGVAFISGGEASTGVLSVCRHSDLIRGGGPVGPSAHVGTTMRSPGSASHGSTAW